MRRWDFILTAVQKLVLFLLICLGGWLDGKGQVPGRGEAIYQYSVAVGGRQAFLWVPPQCRRIRGLIFAAENALELNWMEDPIIRKTAEEEGLGMIWLADGKPTNISFEMKPDAVASLDTMFHDLAVESGFSEIEQAPLIFTGHSWNGRMAWNYPNARPERVLAAIPIRTYPMPDTLLFSGIPLLYIVGQTTELPEYSDGRPGDRDFFWPVVRRTALALRRQNENNLIGVVVHPGGLHMDWSEDQSRFLALFIRKVCRYRLMDGGGLRSIDRRSGWLTDSGGMEPDRWAPAPYALYKGDPKAAYWFFDEEMARAAVRCNGDRKKKQLQMLSFVRDGEKLPVSHSGYVNYKFLPEADGISFKMTGGFLDSIPEGLIGAGSLLGHANGPFTYRVTMGPGRQIGPDEFRVQFTRQKPRNVTIVVTQAGDAVYRKAKQPANVEVPAKLTQGTAQSIDFPVLPDVVVGKKAIVLGATASSGLPVRYYVVAGPARIDGDSLRFTEIPVRSRYPIKITVVAYQWGRMSAPLFQSAEIVTREFYLIKNRGTGAQPPAVWQWSAELKGGREHAGPARAFLWIPEDCRKVRGVVIAQNNMEEESILENPRFRRAMGELGFAEIWVSPAFDHLFRFTEGAGETFNAMMDTLALLSGYNELALAPVVPMGHSAAASWPYYFAAWNPGRTLAALSVSGQWPYFRSAVFAPDIWGDRTIDYVPALETMGEYEAADTWANEGLKERREHPLMPLSMLANPAQGHFAATDVKVDYLALYIRKAAEYRLPKTGTGAVTLRPIDPTKTGWLVDRWRPGHMPMAPAAPVGKYTGDPGQAFWFFDEEMARVTERYEAAYRGLKAPLLGYIQDGALVRQRNTHQQVDLAFQPEADGLHFQLKVGFLDTVPGESPRPAAWTGLPAGSVVGHPADVSAIMIHRIAGPVRELGKNRWVVSLEKGLGANLTHYELWFAAVYPGNGEYQPAVQQAEMVIPVRHGQGVVQHIDFSPVEDRRVGGRPGGRSGAGPGGSTMRLRAVSDAGLPVHFFVLEGPAYIEKDSLLRFTTVPPGSHWPVKVTVVAWQWGRAGSPAVQGAEPVSRSFYLRN